MTISKFESQEQLVADSLSQLEFYNVLDYISKFCITEYGKNKLLSSFPMSDLERLRLELNCLEETKNLLTKYENLPFENFGDVNPKLHKSLIENAILNPEEILSILNLLRLSRTMRSYIFSKSEEFPLLWEEAKKLYENRLLEKHIRDTLDEGGNVRDSASRELFRIRKEIIEKSAKLRRRIKQILKSVAEEEFVQDEFITLREGRFVIPIKVENKSKVSGIIHGVSQTGSTVFVEPAEVIEMNNELSLLQNEERREIYRILQNLTKEIGNEAYNLLNSVEILTHIDSLLAKAKYSLKFNCLKPEILNRKEIYLQDIRHPILVHNRGLKEVIPLTIEFTQSKRGHLISGPNAGGKTVALKSIGLNIALALSGFFPLGYCKTSYFSIFTSIGDLQSIENDLSTFSSQILRLKTILDFSDTDSLILIDEIGSGTDPQEGSALASAILESFVNLNSFFVATTHHSYLKTYALSKSEIENDSLEFDEQYLKPTYRFLQGVPGNSYAFELATWLGLSPHIIKNAKNFLGQSHSSLDETLKTLYRLKIETEHLKTDLSAEKTRYEQLNAKLNEKLNEIKAKRKEFIDNAKIKAYEIIHNANSLIENTIKQIREGQKSISQIKNEFATQKKEIEKQAENVFAEIETKLPSDEGFNVGDSVYIDDPTNIGVILQIYPSQNQVLVDFNGIKFKVSFTGLHKANISQAKSIGSKPSEYFKFSAASRIDIRGKRVNEAVQEIDKYISEAILSNLDTFTVVHGKGTGALRQALHDFFQAHPQVDNFREGTIEEGGAGVTVVKLK